MLQKVHLVQLQVPGCHLRIHPVKLLDCTAVNADGVGGQVPLLKMPDK